LLEQDDLRQELKRQLVVRAYAELGERLSKEAGKKWAAYSQATAHLPLRGGRRGWRGLAASGLFRPLITAADSWMPLDDNFDLSPSLRNSTV
jgi:hypothetical protein